MFKFVERPQSWIDVKWTSRDEEGFAQENIIRMKVIFAPQSEIDSILDGSNKEPIVAFAKRNSLDWEGIVSPDGTPFPFSDANLDKMLEHAPGFRAGFILSYLAGWADRGKAREKNSSASAAAGPAGGGRRRKARASKSS